MTKETNMPFQDQNERAAANPVYGHPLSELVRIRKREIEKDKRIAELEQKCGVDDKP